MEFIQLLKQIDVSMFLSQFELKNQIKCCHHLQSQYLYSITGHISVRLVIVIRKRQEQIIIIPEQMTDGQVHNTNANQGISHNNAATQQTIVQDVNNNQANATATEPAKRVPGVTGKKEWPVRIFSFLLFAATIAIVYVFGMRNNQISNKYYLYVTPPGLFFTIWAVIFTVKAIVNIINLVLNVWTLTAHIWLGINNLLLILWTNIFNIGNDPAVFTSFLIIFLLIPTTLLFWYELGDIKPTDWFTYLARNVYAFYLGWVVAATNVNFGILIVYWWMGSYRTQLIIFWIMAPLSAIGITALNVYKQGAFGLKSCFTLWISVIWAFVGAAITSARCYENGCLPPQ